MAHKRDPMKPDIRTIKTSLEESIEQGQIKPSLMQLTPQEICARPGIIGQRQSIKETLHTWNAMIDHEIEYIAVRAFGLIHGRHTVELYQGRAPANELVAPHLKHARESLESYYTLTGMSQGEKSMGQRFEILDRMARDFVTKILKAPISEKS